MKTAPLLAACLLLALPAAAQTPVPNCTKDYCVVTIIVPAGCGSGIKVAPDPITVKAGDNVDITWNIASRAWAFHTDGIKIYGDGGKFKPKDSKASKGSMVPKVGDTTFTLTNTNDKKAIYKYDINLYTTAKLDSQGRPLQEGKQPCKLDPTIINH